VNIIMSLRFPLALAGISLLSVSASGQVVDLQPGSVFRDCTDCPEMVVVPPGRFMMGSTPEDSELGGVRERDRSREWPAREVTIARPFAIGRYEVTVEDYAAFAEATGRKAGSACLTWKIQENAWGNRDGATWIDPGIPQTGEHPVGCIDYHDSEAYAAWLTGKTGHRYRIPTEAEWEYAARAGTNTLQPWGDTMEGVCQYANVSDFTRAEAHGGLESDPTRFNDCRDGYVFASPVGQFQPNAFGIYDMVGNVWEWVEDCYAVGHDGSPTDGSARFTPEDCELLVVKGGGWYARDWFVRPAARSRELREFRASTMGLRLLREIP
jgi:sulfatase modifying factor 1